MEVFRTVLTEHAVRERREREMSLHVYYDFVDEDEGQQDWPVRVEEPIEEEAAAKTRGGRVVEALALLRKYIKPVRRQPASPPTPPTPPSPPSPPPAKPEPDEALLSELPLEEEEERAPRVSAIMRARLEADLERRRLEAQRLARQLEAHEAAHHDKLLGVMDKIYDSRAIPSLALVGLASWGSSSGSGSQDDSGDAGTLDGSAESDNDSDSDSSASAAAEGASQAESSGSSGSSIASSDSEEPLPVAVQASAWDRQHVAGHARHEAVMSVMADAYDARKITELEARLHAGRAVAGLAGLRRER